MKLIESKATAWVAMAIVVSMVVMSMLLKTPWYGFIAEFFCFVGVFAHLASLYLSRMSLAAGKKLETCALVFIVLSLVAFVTEYVVFSLQNG